MGDFPSLTSDHCKMCTWLFICSFITPKSILSQIPELGRPCMWDPKPSHREVRSPFLRSSTYLTYLRSKLLALKDLKTEWFLNVHFFSSTCWRYNFAHVSIHSEITSRRTSRMGFPRVQGTFVSTKIFLMGSFKKQVYVS